MSEPAASRARARWLAALKLAVAVAILALVYELVPWSDSLRYAAEGDARAPFSGRIVGEWKAEQIHFAFEPPIARSELPDEWLGATADDPVGELDLRRSDATSWQPGLPRVFREVETRGLFIALTLFFAGIVATAVRWWRLLAAAGCPMRFWPALRLTFVGFFFNIVVPGLTGGDLIKAVLVAKDHPERRAAAAISVLVDRLVGVLVLALLGAVAIVAQGERFAALRTPVLAGLGIAVPCALLYGNQRLRKAIGFERWLAKLPFAATLRQIDEAATIYSRHPLEFGLALLFSLLNQCAVLTAIGVLGHSFGERALSAAGYVVVGSIGNLASAVPISPGGLGVTEWFYGELFQQLGGSFALGVAVSIGVRVCMISIGLFGGVFLLLPGARQSVRQAQSASISSP